MSIPMDKHDKALELLQWFCTKRKVTILKIQQLAGLLIFICRGVIVGKSYTRKFYRKISGKLRPYHHVKVDSEIREDCKMWISFLNDLSSVSRPFIDFSKESYYPEDIKFFSDASQNVNFGFGALHNSEWTYHQWEQHYIEGCNPSIAYLELYALTVGIFLWAEKLPNRRVIIFCDNESVLHMINSCTSSCMNCLKLL